MKKNSQGFFKVFFIIFLAVCAYVCYRYSVIYFKRTEVQNTISAIILQNKDNNNDKFFVDKILEKYTADPDVKFIPEAIIIFRNTNGDKLKIDYSFQAPVRLPSVLWGWDHIVQGSVTETISYRSL